MSVLILPNRFKQQPQYAAPLDRGGPFYRHTVFAYSAGRGLQDGKHTGVIGAGVGTITHRYGSGGRYITPADGSSYVQFPSVDDYNVLGNITVIARVRLGTIGTQQAIAIKSASSGGTDTPFGFLIESDGSVALNRSNNAGGASFRVWSSSAKLAAGQTAVIAATQPTDISIPPKFYIDGSFDTGAASSLYGGAGAGAAGSTTNPIQIGNRTDLANRFYGNIFDVIVFNDAFPSHAIDGLSRNIDQVWRAKPRKIWAASATATTHDLTAANATQANVASTATVTQTHVLAVQTSAQPNTASTGAITQAHALAGASSSQANTGTAGAVSQTHALSAAGSVQTNTASTGAIAVGATHNLAAAAATQANTGTPGAITQVHALVGVGGTQTNTGTSGAVSQAHVLGAAGSTQANAASVGAVTVGVVHDLSASPSTQTNAGASGAVSQAHVLFCPASVQDNIAAASAIVQTHILMGASSIQPNAASTGAIEQHSGIPPVDGPAGSGPRLRVPHGHRPAMRNTSRPRQVR